MVNKNRESLLDDLGHMNKETIKINEELKSFQNGVELSLNEYQIKLNDNFNQIEKNELESFHQNLTQTKAELDSKIFDLDKLFNINIQLKNNSNIKQNMIGTLIIDQVISLLYNF